MHETSRIRVIVGAVALALMLPALAGDTVPVVKIPAGMKPSLATYYRNGLKKIHWPTLAELGVPLYPGLRAYTMASGKDKKGHTWEAAGFASPVKRDKVIAWYRKKLPKWKYDSTMKALLGPGCDMSKMLNGVCPFINGMDMSGAKCGGQFPCKATIQISYRKK